MFLCKGMRGPQGGGGVLYNGFGVQETVQDLETPSAPYITKSILNEVLSFQQETKRLPLIEFFFNCLKLLLLFQVENHSLAPFPTLLPELLRAPEEICANDGIINKT